MIPVYVSLLPERSYLFFLSGEVYTMLILPRWYVGAFFCWCQMYDNFDRRMMRRAIRLAQKGRGRVSPNPRVGAVIISRDGHILSTGFHDHFGGSHAEIAALNACRGKDTRGATMYVSLEPCCVQGKTPPCSDAIIQAEIGRVVVAAIDPDPRANGCGIKALKAAGIEVDAGIEGERAKYVNRGFFSFQKFGRAWCAVKVATTIDGKMAAPNGHSQWITGPEASKLAHTLRADHDGVLVGGNTVRNDDPLLTVRSVRGSNPVRIILAPHTGVPPGSKLAQTCDRVRTILVVTDKTKPDYSINDNIETISLPDIGDGTIDPTTLLSILPQYGVLSLLIEGGSGVLSSFMQAGVIDEISVCIAPSIIGDGISPFEKFIPESWETRPVFSRNSVKRYGEDIVITYQRKDEPFLQD